MPVAGFEPTTASSERPQTYTLDRAATWIGKTVFQAFMLLGAVAKLLKAIISFFVCLSHFVSLSAWINSAPTRRIFMKIATWKFF